jgi:RND superfamily putative drug exporter
MFAKIARFSVKFRWPIIVVWILAVPILSSTLPKLSDVSQNDNSAFLPKNSQTQKASELETSFQSKNTSDQEVLVAVRANGVLSASDNAAINRAVARVKAVDGVSQVRAVGTSKDGQAQEYLVGISSKAFGPDAVNLISQIRSQMHTGVPGLQLHLTGQLSQAADSQNANDKGKNNTEIYNVIFIIVLLLLVFRAALAPLVTLIPAGLALTIAQPLIAESTKIGVQVSFITEILLIVLLLGAGTDYGLFLVFRTREELRNGLEPKAAVVKALTRVGESITFSAATVASALLCLLLASFGVYKGLGPALAIGLGVTLLAALTFLPALLSILGRAVFWPGRTKGVKNKIGIWGRVADRVIKRPILTLVIGVSLLLVLSLGVIGYKTGGFGNQAAPAGSDSTLGSQALAKHFPAANNNPQYLLMTFSQPVWNNLTALYQAQNQLAASPTFKAISGPFSINGVNLTPAQLSALHQSGGNSALNQALSQFISADGKVVQFYSVANTAASGSTTAANFTPQVQAALDKAAATAGAEHAQIYGQDAAAFDISRIANSDLKKIIPIVLIIIGIILAILLRSLIAPLYLIASVALSYLAALGFAMLVFVHIQGNDGLNFILPFLMFIFLMALGQDYNILVMSRIREEAHKSKTLKEAAASPVLPSLRPAWFWPAPLQFLASPAANNNYRKSAFLSPSGFCSILSLCVHFWCHQWSCCWASGTGGHPDFPSPLRSSSVKITVMAEREQRLSSEFGVDRFPPKIAILDAGAQYVDLIKKACERHGYPAAVLPIATDYDELAVAYEAVIVSGGPASSHQEGSPMPDLRLWRGELPTLNICYGMHAMALARGFW